MYYSVYFHGGYATHGYHSVPTYNASHGCVRNPIPDSIFIYNWIHLGESIWVTESAETGRAARQTLIAELREHALVIGEVTLSSGQKASYYVDARRALLRPAGFRAAGELIAAAAAEPGPSAVGGPVMAAIPLACAAIAVPAGDGLVGFFVRKERKEHGLQRWVEGPVEPGTRCLVVEDTVTTGGSTVSAIERIRAEGLEIVGDPLRGGPAGRRRRGDRSGCRRPVPGARHDRRALPGPPRRLIADRLHDLVRLAALRPR